MTGKDILIATWTGQDITVQGIVASVFIILFVITVIMIIMGPEEW